VRGLVGFICVVAVAAAFAFTFASTQGQVSSLELRYNGYTSSDVGRKFGRILTVGTQAIVVL